MAELTEKQLIFTDDDGNEVLCDILFTYDSAEFKKSYVFFVPADEAGKDKDMVEVGVASYLPGEEGTGDLNRVETDEEWEMLQKVLDAFTEDEDMVIDED